MLNHMLNNQLQFVMFMVIVLIVLAALFAHQIAPYDPFEINALNILTGPSKDHWFGTDELGRDILSRIIFGARVSLSIAISSVAIASVVGVSVGILAAFFGGRFEIIVMRSIDVFVSLPEIFVAIFVLAFLGNSLPTLIFTVGILYFPQFAWVSHGMARSIMVKEYVMSAVSLGAGPGRIIIREILPNMFSIIIVQISFTLSFAMLLEAGLSFLGLGVMPPEPSWGQMIGQLKNYIFMNPLPVFFPSLILLIAILAINIVGDGLQDYLNPEIDE